MIEMEQTSWTGKITILGIILFVIGILTTIIAADAHGQVFFFGIGLITLSILLWIVPAMWNIAGIADRKTREWFGE